MPSDILYPFRDKIDWEQITLLRKERLEWLERDSVTRFHKATSGLAGRKAEFDFTGPQIIIGNSGDLDNAEQEKFRNAMEVFIPWRKGPFKLFGIDIDAEWQSNLKFDRILTHLDDPAGKLIADIGANNGYFMYRLAHFDPAGVIGFEPTVRHKILFDYLTRFTGLESLQFELLGGEHFCHFTRLFDTVLCLGVLYHHPDPIGMLRGIWNSLQPEGQVIIESQGIPGSESMCLFPEKRYGKAPGIWFIPTESALVNWLQRSGFRDIEVFYKHPMSSSEQRKTEWMQYESYDDYIDPEYPGKTVEGYPAPWRFYVKARKRMN